MLIKMDRLNHRYTRLRHFCDIIFDRIVIVSIGVTAIIGIFQIRASVLELFWIHRELPIEVNSALKTALNTIIILKTYETLKLFVSTNHASVQNILELWLIWLSVKIFFDTNYLNREAGWIFVMLFACYVWIRLLHKFEQKPLVKKES